MNKRELVKTIHVDSANFEHIAKTKNVNGTLLTEIERVMDEYKYPKGQVDFGMALKALNDGKKIKVKNSGLYLSGR